MRGRKVYWRKNGKALPAQRVHCSFQTESKAWHRQEAGSSTAETHKKVRMPEAWSERQGIGKAGEAGRVQSMEKLKPRKGCK